jgi:D-hexose-6-phosphate mutarotase
MMREILETSEDLRKALQKEKTRHSKCSLSSAFHKSYFERGEIGEGWDAFI